MITQPTLFLDKKRCKQNILNMFAKAQKHQVELRPHFKTHQSLAIGRWFKEIGVSKITVSSIKMANYFASEWNDITIAFPVNILEIDTINTLAEKITLNLLVESKETTQFLAENLKHPVNLFLKIDVGTHRTGIKPTNLQLINTIVNCIDSSSTLNFSGFLGHSGHTYQCNTEDCIKQIQQENLRVMQALKQQYPVAKISLGDTPSCSVAEDFTGVDEIRPGNFVFYDITQQKIGSNTFDKIAVALAVPIVAIHKERNELVVYGGGVHLSKDRVIDGEHTIFGRVVMADENGLGEIIPTMYVKSLSQEHGIIKVLSEDMDNYSIGDLLYILPVHSCMTADLMKSYQTFEGETISMLK